MIKMVRLNDRKVPLLFCDVCGERIINGKMAVVFLPELIKEEGSSTYPLFAHKIVCAEIMTCEVGSAIMGVGDYFYELIAHAGMLPEDLEAYNHHNLRNLPPLPKRKKRPQ